MSAEKRPVPEALLHDLWRRQHFDTEALRTPGDRPVTVRAPGCPNTDAGPDFRQAHVRVGMRPENALEAQGQHQLYRTHEARCLECRIGQHVLES